MAVPLPKSFRPSPEYGLVKRIYEHKYFLLIRSNNETVEEKELCDITCNGKRKKSLPIDGKCSNVSTIWMHKNENIYRRIDPCSNVPQWTHTNGTSSVTKFNISCLF